MAQVKQLVDKEGTSLYPVTKAECTYMRGGTVSVQTVLDDTLEDGNVTEFLSTGQIKVTHASGNISTTTFLTDGSIKEVTKDADETTLYTKLVTFGDDGTITTKVTYEGEE